MTDLTRNDFQVKERGRPQIISTFTRNEAQQSTAIDAGLPHLGNFSNSFSRTGSADVLLLDGTETNWKDWKRGWPQVLRFLQSLKSGERIAIYLLDPVHGLEVLQDYDDDPRDLSAKLQNLRNPSLSMLLQSAHEDEVLPPPAFSHRNERLDAPELLSLGRIQGITDAIEAITDHLAGVPGRKSLIWFAGRFPNPYRITGNPILQPYRSRLQNALSRLMSTDVAIYPVDARGLIPDHSFDAENRIIFNGPLKPGWSPVLPLFDFSTMLELASGSGGKAISIRTGWNNPCAMPSLRANAAIP